MSRMINLDFTGVQDGFKNVTKAGTYNVKIDKVEAKKSQTGNPYLNWETSIIDGEFKGCKLWHVTSLQPQALFNLRNLLVAAGLDVPKSVVKIDLDSVLGRIVAAKVVMEEYQGEQRPKIKEIKSASVNETIDEAIDNTFGDDIDVNDIDLDGLDL